VLSRVCPPLNFGRPYCSIALSTVDNNCVLIFVTMHVGCSCQSGCYGRHERFSRSKFSQFPPPRPCPIHLHASITLMVWTNCYPQALGALLLSCCMVCSSSDNHLHDIKSYVFTTSQIIRPRIFAACRSMRPTPSSVILASIIIFDSRSKHRALLLNLYFGASGSLGKQGLLDALPDQVLLALPFVSCPRPT
jgi:hypothetical protein